MADNYKLDDAKKFVDYCTLYRLSELHHLRRLPSMMPGPSFVYISAAEVLRNIADLLDPPKRKS